MSWDPDLKDLETILSDLFPDPAQARRIVDYAQLLDHRISFEGKSIDIWHSILSQAHISGKVQTVIEFCIEESDGVELKDAYSNYLERKSAPLQTEEDDKVSDPSSLEREYNPVTLSVNTLYINEPSPTVINPDESAYAEYVECRITFYGDNSLAAHEYHYILRNFGYKEGEDKFHFFIPNTPPVQVTLNKASGSNHQDDEIEVKKTSKGKGTLLLFKNIPRPDPGGVIEVLFSYDAPTTDLFYRGPWVDVSYYQAELFHDFENTKTVRAIITLPPGASITIPKGFDAKVAGSTVIFEGHNLLKEEKSIFPIFFVLKKKWGRRIILISLLLAAILSGLFGYGISLLRR